MSFILHKEGFIRGTIKSMCLYWLYFAEAWPSDIFPSDGHAVFLSYGWLSSDCLLSGVPIGPFSVRWERSTTWWRLSEGVFWFLAIPVSVWGLLHPGPPRGVVQALIKCPTQGTSGISSFCDSVGIRTQDPQLRRLLLYPTELPNRSVVSAYAQ